MYTVGSVFSGVGMFDLAFDLAGFEIVFQVENDEYCQRVLQKHWPDLFRVSDVRNATGDILPCVDVLAGGFPCTDISLAGKGAGLSGERSGLWFEFERIIGELRPRVVFLENVPAIAFRGGPTVIAPLAEMGYVGAWGVISAADAGAAHRRDRWWCVAYAASDYRNIRHDVGSNGWAEQAKQAGLGSQKRMGDSHSEGSQGWLPSECSGEWAIGSASLGNPECSGRSGITRGRTGTQPENGHNKRSRSAEPGMGRATHGITCGVDIAGPGQPQFAWESSRTIPARSIPNRPARLAALGNGGYVPLVYLLALEIRGLLDCGDVRPPTV